jgi:hypothetical protein
MHFKQKIIRSMQNFEEEPKKLKILNFFLKILGNFLQGKKCEKKMGVAFGLP